MEESLAGVNDARKSRLMELYARSRAAVWNVVRSLPTPRPRCSSYEFPA